MDLAAIRAQVREVNFAVHGVAADVTVPNGTPVATRVIWMTPEPVDVPGDGFRRNATRRVMAIRRDDVPAVTRGTLVAVTEHLLDDPIVWQVDSMDTVRSDHYRVVVVPYEGES